MKKKFLQSKFPSTEALSRSSISMICKAGNNDTTPPKKNVKSEEIGKLTYFYSLFKEISSVTLIPPSTPRKKVFKNEIERVPDLKKKKKKTETPQPVIYTYSPHKDKQIHFETLWWVSILVVYIDAYYISLYKSYVYKIT